MFELRVIGTLVKINLQQELAYRTDALVNILVNLMWLGWELLSLNILFSNTATLGGWGPGELIALLGVFRLVNSPNTAERCARGSRTCASSCMPFTIRRSAFGRSPTSTRTWQATLPTACRGMLTRIFRGSMPRWPRWRGRDRANALQVDADVAVQPQCQYPDPFGA